ncbi:MAG: CHRD domain-containing protein [Pseudomonadota bacterium]
MDEEMTGAPTATEELTITRLVSFDTGVGEGGSEVVSFDSGRLYVTNGAADRIDIFDPADPESLVSIDLSMLPDYDGVQSVAAGGGLIAVAAATLVVDGARQPGIVALFDQETLALVNVIEVGALPDSITISPNGLVLGVANEGEFNSESGEDGVTEDAPGAITLIGLEDPANPITVEIPLVFPAVPDELAAELRISPESGLPFDAEPEFVAFSPTEPLLYVSLQENNAIAVVDVLTATIVDIFSAGSTDFNGIGIDATDDGIIDIVPRDLLGLRMPDAVEVVSIGGEDFLITANEGDGRGDAFDDGEPVPFGDEARVEELAELDLLDASLYETVEFALTTDQVVPQNGAPAPTDSTATGTVTLDVIELDDGSTAVAYTIAFDGLDLVETPEERVDANDVTGIHFHVGAAGENGPHVLNVFGLPRMDDADAVIDFEAETITGIYDNGDANDGGDGMRDGNDSVALADVFADFVSGDIYLAVHTVGFNLPDTAELRGQVAIEPIDDLSRLIISTVDGDTDNDGRIEQITTFGSRSFTIFDTDGNEVFDSGSTLERIVAEIAPERFNDDDGEPNQNRSDAKGPEPEAVATGVIGGETYAFIGAERDSGVFVFNISDPTAPTFVTYIDGFENGDISPETIAFIPADESSSGNAQIAVAYEVSGETVLFDVAEASDAPTEPPVVLPDEVVDTGAYYLALLGRDADDAGGNFFVDRMLSPTELAAAFLNSDEFTSANPDASIADIVDQLYEGVYGRAGEAGGDAHWAAVGERAGAEELVANFVSAALAGQEGGFQTGDPFGAVEVEPGVWDFA